MSEQTSWESPAISDAIGDLDSAARRLVSLGLDDDAAKDWFAESLFRRTNSGSVRRDRRS